MDLHPGRPLAASEIAELLTEARARTLLLTAPLSPEELTAQHNRLMSPIVWDLGHIAHFEEVWLLEKLAEGEATASEGLRGVWDPFTNPRASRGELELPGRTEALDYLGRVRQAVLESLREDGGGGNGGPLRKDGFVYRMVLQHEYQHNETILQTLQLKSGRPYPAPRAVHFPGVETLTAPPPGAMVRFPGGRVVIGTDDRSAAYDNERPAHEVELEPFWIDAAPVRNGEYLEFMEDGGYTTRSLWSDDGWAWLQEEGVRAPRHWESGPRGWRERVLDRERPVDPHRPVCHVCYHEAAAWARWAGKRLPTEFEWEAAATWDPDTGTRSRFPWGDEAATPDRANVDALAFDTAPVGAFPDNISPVGCYGMIGDVWEWTSSDFQGYPGYETFPYEEYSEVFFGSEYRVLRGGSWATRTGAIRASFRNWDFPIRRQIFAGFRCARDDG
jgi:iron(II)-dependent oxidoreductase